MIRVCNSCGTFNIDDGHACRGGANSFPRPTTSADVGRDVNGGSVKKTEGFETLHETWMAGNGSRSPSIRHAMKWMFDRLASPTDTTHSCHDECQKPGCVMRRERDACRDLIREGLRAGCFAGSLKERAEGLAFQYAESQD